MLIWCERKVMSLVSELATRLLQNLTKFLDFFLSWLSAGFSEVG